jgi:polyphosphate kinase 2 (PPK2 family)
MLADEGTVMVKCFLHLSDPEQLRRFKSRQTDPLRRWKLTDEDWRNRDKRDDYLAAIEEMLKRTSSPQAPWTLVEAENKRWARVKVIETVVDAMTAGLDRYGMPVPDL